MIVPVLNIYDGKLMMNTSNDSEKHRDKIENLLAPYPELLVRKNLDQIRRETNLPVSRAILYKPPRGLKVVEIGSRKLVWKEDLVTYLCSLVKKPL